jgi:DNA-binding response OmpR family regulator
MSIALRDAGGLRLFSICDPMLIVEDNADSAELTAFIAEKMGYSVLIAETVSAARLVVEKLRFSLIVLDVNLPDGNGIDLCRWIRTVDPYTPVLIHSATAISGREALSAGADAFIPKCGDITMMQNAFSHLAPHSGPATISLSNGTNSLK